MKEEKRKKERKKTRRQEGRKKEKRKQERREGRKEERRKERILPYINSNKNSTAISEHKIYNPHVLFQPTCFTYYFFSLKPVH